MKRFRIYALILLFFNSITAIYGGLALIMDPTGAFLQMPLTFLSNSPFRDFLFPGIILLSANGLLSFWVAIKTLKKKRNYELWIIAQGIILIIWLSVQIFYLREFFAPLHFPYYVAGTGLILMGTFLRKRNIRT